MKRYIKSSSFEFTDFIDENYIPGAIQEYMETENADYALTKAAVEAFFEELNKFPSPNSMDLLDIIYDLDKRRFYKKYVDFADACEDRAKSISPSGYGIDDYEQLRIRGLLRKVTFNFPYGWKR